MEKLQKVLNEVERLQSELIKEKKKGNGSEVDDACILELQNIKNYIKFVQEEPVSEDLEKAAQEYVTKEGYLAGLHYNSMVRSFKAGAEWHTSHNTKLPDNLLLAARKMSIDMCDIDDKYLDEYPYNPIAEQKFIEGAQWQKEQFEKDYTDLCNGIATAKGLAVTMAYDKGMADAREQMMAKAVDATLLKGNLIKQERTTHPLHIGDKVKVILIKREEI